jgi:hypothetical protein
MKTKAAQIVEALDKGKQRKQTMAEVKCCSSYYRKIADFYWEREVMKRKQ